jgi:hypothetical protein
VKVQVTKDKFIDTDDIAFAEGWGMPPNDITRVLLKNGTWVDIHRNFHQFVETINKFSMNHTGKNLIRGA